MLTPEEYMKGIDRLRDAIVAAATVEPSIMYDYEMAVAHSGLPRKSDYSTAQQQVAFKEAKVILEARLE